MKKHTFYTKIICLVLLFVSLKSDAQNIKVFILAGQSNAEGQGEIEPADNDGTLINFLNNGGDVEFNNIRNSDSTWNSRKDVWVRYEDEGGNLRVGELTVGYGAQNTLIGPELLYGSQLGDYFTDTVLIIKTCWGGKSLAEDFRPPSSGGQVGPFYTKMIADINQAITNIGSEFPQYNNQSIEIAGFCWFQGWNDGDNQAFLNEYEQNLINLISDVRDDLNVPNLPFIVGLTGNGGLVIESDADGYVISLQTELVPAQINAANFSGHSNVCYADTRSFWKRPGESPEPDFGHHWFNNAESYIRIGNEFGQKMIDLIELNCTNTPKSLVYEGSGYGNNLYSREEVQDNSFGAGYSFYSAVWQFKEEYPGAINFQTGQGTWVTPQNESLPDDFYNTIEGGLGWWGNTRYGTKVPKFIMGGVANSFDAAANGPGVGFTDYIGGDGDDGQRDWSTSKGKYGAAQLSRNVLWPPDGLNMDESSNGEFLGYGYHPLPIIDSLDQLNGVNWKVGNQSWTLFLNTQNFKGPVSFFIPSFWSELTTNDRAYEGLFLDSRPSDPNQSFAQEYSASPSILGEDNNGNVYSRVTPAVYPRTTDNTSHMVRDISVYSQEAKWNDVESWFNGGPAASTEMKPSGTIQVDFNIDNSDPSGVDAAIHNIAPGGPEIDTIIDQFPYGKIKTSADKKVVYFEWDTTVVDDIGTGFKMPEYYRFNPNVQLWVPEDVSNIPYSSGVTSTKPITNPIRKKSVYLTPLETESHLYGQPNPWNSPGPVAGPYTTHLGDGTKLTYYWYKFIDQPAIIYSNLPQNVRTKVQERVELIHTNWKKTDNYLPDPTGGTLVKLDSGLVIDPPAGYEIGYVPIVTRQEYVGHTITAPVDTNVTDTTVVDTNTTNIASIDINQDRIKLSPNPNSGIFIIKGELKNSTIQILSYNGSIQKTLANQSSPIKVDIGDLPPGLYFVQIYDSTKTIISVEKVIKL